MSTIEERHIQSSIPRASTSIRIAFLTDVVTPYLAVALESLARIADLTALFCSLSGTRGMDWTVDLPFRHQVLGGLTIRRRLRDGTDYYLSPRIVSALHRARPEVIISSGFSTPTAYAALYGHARGVPLLIQSDGTSASEKRLRAEQRLSRTLLRRLAWGAVANSEPARRRFEEMGFPAERVLRAPHVVRVDAFSEARRLRHDQPGGPLRLLSVGRLIPAKGGAWLVRAVSEARHRGADIELDMAGSGAEERSLKRLASELRVPVTWRGFVDQTDLPKLYAQADAFAFPTLDDTFGIVLVEAAATGLPLISSPFAGASEELVRHGVNGFIVDPTNTSALAAAILRLANDPDLRERMGRASHMATKNRTPAASASEYLRAAKLALTQEKS